MYKLFLSKKHDLITQTPFKATVVPVMNFRKPILHSKSKNLIFGSLYLAVRDPILRQKKWSVLMGERLKVSNKGNKVRGKSKEGEKEGERKKAIH